MNKEELLKAIEQKRQEIWPTDTGEMAPATVPNNLEQGWLNALTWMENLINSLPSAEEQPSEDLEEAATNEARKRYRDIPALNIGGDYEPPECYNEDRELFVEAALWGANWQKEQMMKSAINGIMDCDDSNEWVEITDGYIVTPPMAGKKVKFIIMEDEQCSTE